MCQKGRFWAPGKSRRCMNTVVFTSAVACKFMNLMATCVNIYTRARTRWPCSASSACSLTNLSSAGPLCPSLFSSGLDRPYRRRRYI